MNEEEDFSWEQLKPLYGEIFDQLEKALSKERSSQATVLHRLSQRCREANDREYELVATLLRFHDS